MENGFKNNALTLSNKDVVKEVLKSKLFLGSVVIGGAFEGIKLIKAHSIVAGIKSFLFKGAGALPTLLGVPIGGTMAQLLSIAVGGMIIVEGVKCITKIKLNPEDKMQIIAQSATSIVVMLAGVAFIIHFGMSLINSAESISIPAF